MVKVTAQTVEKDGKQGVQLSCSLEGTGEEIVNEVLISIRAIIGGVKEKSHGLYSIMIATMAHDESILKGERGTDDEDESAMRLAEVMSRSIVKKGVN